jgi:Spy/CpxP family protein refolding chaperone
MRRLRSPRVLLAVTILAAVPVAALVASARVATSMAGAANKFLGSLTPEERQTAALPFEGDERMRWHYIPNEQFPRKGVMLKNLTEAQRQLAHDLIKTGLSQRGYMTASSIMEMETILKAIEDAAGNRRFARDHLEYFVTIFGTPSAKGAWGWRVNGHHVGLNFTINDGNAVASSPTFFGSNPAEVREGPQKGTRLLGAQEDAGRALVTALDEKQRATAIIKTEALNEIVTTNTPKIDPLNPTGLAASDMTPAQRELLMKVVDSYVALMAADIASDRMAKIKQAGTEKIAFAWAGETERGKKHYYRVQGPTFLIEYDNSQNDGNHVHSVWRDFNGDFGRDLLREHLAQYPH